jgi:putative phosphonate transport system ATP-binding protein
MTESDPPLMRATGLTVRYGDRYGCQDVSLTLWPGEVLAVVGESGSGKTTLLRVLAGRLTPEAGTLYYRDAAHQEHDVFALPDAARRRLERTEWAYVHQNPRDGLRMAVSAGANVGERLMANGVRHWGAIRASTRQWMERVELETARIDESPATFSGGMQQRLQIARNLISGPRLALLDEPTSALDVSVQARLLDLLRGLTRSLGLATVIVTHDLAIARLLAQRMMVMKDGKVVETGLTDQVLDDPQHPYTQLLVASVPQG